MLHYPVKLTTEGEFILVDFPDFPEAHTFGETREEALRRASDAPLTVIEAYMKDRQRLPQPSRGKPTVTVPPLTVPKIELYKAMQQKRITKAELGRRLGWHIHRLTASSMFATLPAWTDSSRRFRPLIGDWK